MTLNITEQHSINSRSDPDFVARAGDVAVEFREVGKRFGERRVLEGFSLRVAAGEMAWLSGPSGAGKTTVLRLAAGLEAPDSGEILINGIRASGDKIYVPPAGRGLGMVFQDFALWPHLTVAQHLGFVLAGKRLTRSERRERAAAVLELVELSDRRRARPRELSGGEQQRLAIARALVLSPSLILLDEPFAHLHSGLKEKILGDVVRRRDRENAAVIIASHNPAEIEAAADKVVVMKG